MGGCLLAQLACQLHHLLLTSTLLSCQSIFMLCLQGPQPRVFELVSGVGCWTRYKTFNAASSYILHAVCYQALPVLRVAVKSEASTNTIKYSVP